VSRNAGKSLVAASVTPIKTNPTIVPTIIYLGRWLARRESASCAAGKHRIAIDAVPKR
jgi:hypothetical protein